ncbi:T9SS type A sorting domain-containing protein [Ignavibacterium album]|uniref:T9SS type A sorting domain-containing protein n=1 Tax=Ignavibacterium album TaxID=591197 RepID=UPI0035B85642
MKSIFFITVAFFFSVSSIAQQISDLNGLETQSGRTYLFYREGNPTPYNSIYKFDPETLQDTMFLYGYISWTPFGNTSRANNDFEFFPNDSVNFMSVGNEYDIDFWGTIRRNDTLSFSIPLDIIKVDISKQNPQKVFAGGGYDHLFRSFDGGYNFPIDSIMQFAYLSMSPFNDNILFGLDSTKRLIKSFDGGYTSVLVDTSKTDDLFGSKFFYDSDQQHIYRIAKSYGKYVFLTSNNNGNQFSWTKTFESDFPLWVSNDPSISGNIYLGNLRYIYKSTDFGSTFSLYKTFDSRISGIYKKPDSDILYASTRYRIYKITPNTITVVKSFSIPFELFSYYPLKVGNKWIYDKTTIVYDFPPQITYDTVIKKVIRDSVAQNNKKYFVLKEESISGSVEYFLERIDSATGKVFRFVQGFNYPDDELLIDDLTAEIGDTIEAFRYGIWYPGGVTVLREEDYFTKWGLNNKRKIFETDNYGMPLYSLTYGLGLDSAVYGFDFGTTTYVLRGCVINGTVFGDTVLSVEKNEEIPTNFVLYQNYPNPFNPGTTISWQSPVSGWQTLKIYDILGNEIATLVDEYREAGRYKIEFDASSLASGVYIYKLTAGSFISSKKMILIK